MELPRPLILGSRSPQRAAMLRDAGYTFVQRETPYVDPPNPNPAANGPAGAADGRAVALGLALRKALSVPEASLESSQVLLTADTLGVDPQGRLIGTPETLEEARAMLRGLVGQTHTIVSAAVLRTPGRPLVELVDAAAVPLGHISDAQLEAYLQDPAGPWKGKAGGYNLAERRAAGWSLTVQGEDATVMGLPLRQLKIALHDLQIEPFLLHTQICAK